MASAGIISGGYVRQKKSPYPVEDVSPTDAPSKVRAALAKIGDAAARTVRDTIDDIRHRPDQTVIYTAPPTFLAAKCDGIFLQGADPSDLPIKLARSKNVFDREVAADLGIVIMESGTGRMCVRANDTERAENPLDISGLDVNKAEREKTREQFKRLMLAAQIKELENKGGTSESKRDDLKLVQKAVNLTRSPNVLAAMDVTSSDRTKAITAVQRELKLIAMRNKSDPKLKWLDDESKQKAFAEQIVQCGRELNSDKSEWDASSKSNQDCFVLSLNDGAGITRRFVVPKGGSGNEYKTIEETEGADLSRGQKAVAEFWDRERKAQARAAQAKVSKRLDRYTDGDSVFSLEGGEASTYFMGGATAAEDEEDLPLF